MTDKTGGPAFPAPAGVSHITTQGMTLRDWFAGMAMQAYVTSQIDMTQSNVSPEAKDVVARIAYQFADSMLKVREAK